MRNILSILAVAAFVVIILMMAVKDRKAIDPECVNDCKQRGFDSSYCKSRCSTDSYSAEMTSKRADAQCMHNCEISGKDNDFCTKACTY